MLEITWLGFSITFSSLKQSKTGKLTLDFFLELEFNCASKFKFSSRLINCACNRTTDPVHIKQDLLGIEALISNGFPKSIRQSAITTYMTSLF